MTNSSKVIDCGGCILARQKASPIHFGVKRVQMHQLSSFSKSFTTNGVKKGTNRIFIPGCSLAGYSKTIVEEAFSYLKSQLNDVELLMICCGQPSLDIGDKKKFMNQLEKIQKIVDNSHIKQIIVACENCYYVYKKFLKRVEIITLWEIINEIGIPKKLKQHYKTDTVYALHDPCRVRKETQIHESVRNILHDLGVSVQEFDQNRSNTKCCGAINMNHMVNPDLFRELATQRANSTEVMNIISYCQTCVDTLSITGKKTLHIADLMFNEEVICGKEKTQQKNGFITTWKNKWDLAHK